MTELPGSPLGPPLYENTDTDRNSLAVLWTAIFCELKLSWQSFGPPLDKILAAPNLTMTEHPGSPVGPPIRQPRGRTH